MRFISFYSLLLRSSLISASSLESLAYFARFEKEALSSLSCPYLLGDWKTLRPSCDSRASAIVCLWMLTCYAGYGLIWPVISWFSSFCLVGVFEGLCNAFMLRGLGPGPILIFFSFGSGPARYLSLTFGVALSVPTVE